MNTAIITGASSGLGAEYTRAVADAYPELDEIWLIARRENKMRELCEKLPGVRLRIIPLDLAAADSFDTLDALLRTDCPDVRILINCAGVGLLGNVADVGCATQTAMVDVNVRALCAVTSLVLPYMRRDSFIINVCSVAAFVPNARLTVYSATKAFVLSYSKSLRYELKKKRINVTAVCPGPMKTEFLSVAKIEGNSKTFDMLPACEEKQVAVRSLKKARAGRAVYTNRLFYKLYRVLAKLLPHNWLMPLTKT